MIDAGPTRADAGTSTGTRDAAATPPLPADVTRERPVSVPALFEYAYAEAGRRLGLARKDIAALTVDDRSLDQDIALVRRLAASDRLLAVPPIILATVAELAVEGEVRRRIVDLVQVALGTHPLFAGQRGGPYDGGSEPVLDLQDLSDGVNRLSGVELGLRDPAEFKSAVRERLRINAVTSAALVRVLKHGWTPERFTAEMAALVWKAPYRRGPQAAALLASARNGEALGQLCRQFEAAARHRERDLEDAQASSQHQHRRAVTAEADVERLTQQLSEAVARNDTLSTEVVNLSRQLGTEQANRVVDKSHLVDDYEVLRTQVLRRLTKQVGLLSDGLHALRNGSPEVAEEFVDRALTAISSEIGRLKDLDGGVA